MKTLRFYLLLLVTVLLFNFCNKSESMPGSATPKVPTKIEDLSVKSTFDWKTAKAYTITLSAPSSRTVQIVSINGAVYYKAFLLANTLNTIDVSLPAYEKTVKVLFNGKTVDLSLTSSTLTLSL